MFVYHIFITIRFDWLMVLSLYKEDYLQIINYTAGAVSGKVERS